MPEKPKLIAMSDDQAEALGHAMRLVRVVPFGMGPPEFVGFDPDGDAVLAWESRVSEVEDETISFSISIASDETMHFALTNSRGGEVAFELSGKGRFASTVIALHPALKAAMACYLEMV